MKRASNAQARFLRLVADLEAQGHTLLLRDPTADTRHGRGRPERRLWLSLKATALGVVEVLPDQADLA